MGGDTWLRAQGTVVIFPLKKLVDCALSLIIHYSKTWSIIEGADGVIVLKTIGGLRVRRAAVIASLPRTRYTEEVWCIPN